MPPKNDQIVVVTGSSGFLGQHIVKLLQENDEQCGQIVLFDKRPYVNNLGHKEDKPMKQYVADVKSMDSLLEAFAGADFVIHAAAVVDTSLFPNVKEMSSTNIGGTQNVIDACIKTNVKHLIFTSTTDIVCGSEHIFYGMEATTPIPTTFMLGLYGETKCKAEKLVLEASGKSLANGETLRTVSLRPVPLYGPQDKHFFYKALRYIKDFASGYYLRIRSLDERLQVCYVGNAAWAHIDAKNRIAEDESISGEAIFITDETPIIDIHQHLRVYAEARGFKISSFVFPYWLAWILLSLYFVFIRAVNLLFRYDVNIPNVNELNYMCSTFFFNRSKATLRLNYNPIVGPERGTELAYEYYSTVNL